LILFLLCFLQVCFTCSVYCSVTLCNTDNSICLQNKTSLHFYADGIGLFVNYLCQAHSHCTYLQSEYQYRFLVNCQVAGEEDIWLCPCCERTARSTAAQCTSCKKVWDDDDALTCDNCSRWTHRTCDTGEFMLLCV